MALIRGIDFGPEVFKAYRQWIKDLEEGGRRLIGYELSAGMEGVIIMDCNLEIPSSNALKGIDAARDVYDAHAANLTGFNIKYVYDKKKNPVKHLLGMVTVHMEGFFNVSKEELEAIEKDSKA